MPFPRIRLPFNIPAIEDLAIPAVSILIIFLAYTSQFLFYHIEPGPLSRKEATWFNIFVLGIWWCYYWACTVDPGRKGWVEKFAVKGEVGNENGEELKLQKGMRWCKKCEAIKPPRAHHCKKCGRYISFLLSPTELIADERADVSQKWTTTAPGPQIASLTYVQYPSSRTLSSS
jgi:palmitoyltransferase